MRYNSTGTQDYAPGPLKGEVELRNGPYIAIDISTQHFQPDYSIDTTPLLDETPISLKAIYDQYDINNTISNDPPIQFEECTKENFPRLDELDYRFQNLK